MYSINRTKRDHSRRHVIHPLAKQEGLITMHVWKSSNIIVEYPNSLRAGFYRRCFSLKDSYDAQHRAQSFAELQNQICKMLVPHSFS